MLSNARLQLGPTPKSFTLPAKGEIFAVDTVLGRVSASHNPAHSLGGPNGVYLKNTILVTIAFKEPVIFDEAIVRTSTLLRYFGMLVGRPQNVLSRCPGISSHSERGVRYSSSGQAVRGE